MSNRKVNRRPPDLSRVSDKAVIEYDRINPWGTPGYFEHKYSKPVTRELALAAMAKTNSNKAAARYLNVGYQHWKKFAKLYIDDETGLSFFDLHKNQAGKGIPKFFGGKKKEDAPILDIIEGRIPVTNFHPDKIRARMINEGLLKEECYMCGYHEKRLLDYKAPLLLSFKDGRKTNYRLDNVQLLCYNCYFVSVGDIFTSNDILKLEHYKEPTRGLSEEIDFQLDDYQLQKLRELGFDDYEPGDEFISRW